MAEAIAANGARTAQEISAGQVNHLPIVAHYARRSGLVEIVNALFFKRPERLEALGLILLISLLIWRLIELVMRTELQARQATPLALTATIPGWDNKPTARPTAYMETWKFKGVLILCVDGQRLLAKPLTDTQHAFLQALQVPASCFTRYPCDG